jgi:hypothetical protein
MNNQSHSFFPMQIYGEAALDYSPLVWSYHSANKISRNLPFSFLRKQKEYSG